MPRRKRIVLPCLPHHIVQRGHDRRAVFITDRDRESCLETLAEFRTLLGIKVYAYCLMTNHFHLIVDPGTEAANLSLLMKRLAGRHSRRINRLERRSGTAWNGRFKCSPIETDRYLLACSRYVDLNPVRACMVAHPADYPWSSYRSTVGLNKCDWLDFDPRYVALASALAQGRAHCRSWVEGDLSDPELQFIRGAVQRNQLTGSARFILEVEQRIGERILFRERGCPRSAA